MKMEGMPIDIKMELDAPHGQIIGLTPVRKMPPFYRANELEAQGKHTEACEIYQQMLEDDLGNVCILAALGMNYAVQGKNGIANVLLSQAYSSFDDNFDHDLAAVGVIAKEVTKGGHERFVKMKKSEIMNAIGTTWKSNNNTVKARYWFERAQNLVELNADIQNNLATLYINEGNPEGAMRHLDIALGVNPEHAQAHWNRSLARLENGDYDGFEEYGWGKRAEVRMDRNYSNQKTPEWDGKPGQTVIVYGEQGIGDEIMFASMLPDLIRDSKQVVFDCHKKLHRLFCASFPNIDIYPTREDENIMWPLIGGPSGPSNRYPVDAKVAIGDLGKFYRRSIEAFPGNPYIVASEKAAVKWASVLADMFPDDKPVIALNWIGGHKKTRVEVRSMTLESWLPILQQDAHFVSLQYTKCEEEIAAFEAKHGIRIHHLPQAAYSDHYDDVAGVVGSVDLVLTCCSSIVHLAGAMGVPCWVLTPSRPAWRYRLDLDYMPWYGQTVTLFRQAGGSVDWAPVIEEVASNLKELCDVRATGSEAERHRTESEGTAEAGPTAVSAG